MTPRGDAVLSVHVVGTPKQQGSKRGFVVAGKDGGKARAVIVDDNKKPLKDWRTDVVVGVQRVIGESPAGTFPLVGPVAVRLVFAMPRPARPKFLWPAVKPDIDKLERAVLDAMTDAGAWKDDALVVDLHTSKHYPGPDIGQHVPGVRITVHRVGEQPAAVALPIPSREDQP